MTANALRVRAAISAWRAIQRYPRLATVARRPARAAWESIKPRALPVMPDSARDWPSAVRDRRRRAGAVLVIDDRVPEFDKHAGGLFVQQLIDLLCEADLKVNYLPDDRFPRQPYTRALQRSGVEVMHGHFDLERWMHFNGPYLDWVVTARPHVAPRYIPLVRRYSAARLLYYTHDLHWLRERRRFDSTGELDALRESERLKSVEKSIARAVDAVLTPSVDEVAELKRLAPGAEVHAIPPSVCLTAPSSDRPALAARQAVVFVAGFNHAPNVDAAQILVREVMPIVWRRQPHVRVLLVGSSPRPQIRALESELVTVTGFVPDLQPYYDLARVSVNPLRYGAGVKGKLLSSIEAGVPVITTSIGNEGIQLEHGRQALVGETPAQLAAHVLRLFDEPSLAGLLLAAAQEFLLERFGRARTRVALHEALGLPAR